MLAAQKDYHAARDATPSIPREFSPTSIPGRLGDGAAEQVAAAAWADPEEASDASEKDPGNRMEPEHTLLLVNRLGDTGLSMDLTDLEVELRTQAGADHTHDHIASGHTSGVTALHSPDSCLAEVPPWAAEGSRPFCCYIPGRLLDQRCNHRVARCQKPCRHGSHDHRI